MTVTDEPWFTGWVACDPCPHKRGHHMPQHRSEMARKHNAANRDEPTERQLAVRADRARWNTIMRRRKKAA